MKWSSQVRIVIPFKAEQKRCSATGPSIGTRGKEGGGLCRFVPDQVPHDSCARGRLYAVFLRVSLMQIGI